MNYPGVDLSNTPGIYYAISYVLYALLYASLLPKRKTAVSRAAAIVFSAAIITGMIVTFQRIPTGWFLPFMAGMFLLVFGIVYALCDVDWRSGLYCTCRAFLLAEFAASLEWQLFYYGLTSFGLPLNMRVNLAFLLPTHAAVFLAAWFLEKNAKGGSALPELRPGQLLSVIVTTLLVYALSNLSYAFSNTPFSSRYTAEIFALRTITDLAGVAILFGYHMVLQEMHAEREVRELEQIVSQQVENYRISEDSIDLVNRKYHDLKHQIEYLRGDLSEPEKTAFLDEMEKEVQVYEATNRTGNHVVDTVLMQKQLRAQRQQIKMTVVADGHAMDFLSTAEICSLLGNALENALEAASKVADPAERLVSVSLDETRGFMRLRVENRFEGKVRMRNGLPETTAVTNRHLHGFGVRSMQAVAEAHGGNVAIETADGWFVLKVLIPKNSA